MINSEDFIQISGDTAVSSGKCPTYKLEIDEENPPSFTESFKLAVQSLHDLTVETRPHRLTVVKTGPRTFNTTLNSTTERKFDSAFSDFIRDGSKNIIYCIIYTENGGYFLLHFPPVKMFFSTPPLGCTERTI